MTVVYFDSKQSDGERRKCLYAGDLFVYSPTPNSLALVRFAKEYLAKAFPGLEPETAQFHMSVDQYAEVLAKMKPAFIHDPECKRLLPGILRELGCDAQQTYFDVPRMRSSTSDGYLTTGIAYAFHAHRDTWYSAPMNQINWWLPIFPLAPDNGMAFHPAHWSKGVANTSSGYNYQEWNKTSRFQAAQQVGVDTRRQPYATEAAVLEPDIRIVPPPGGIIVFAAAQLHSSIANTSGRTRFSIDFRTVNLDDVKSFTGAPNVDSHSTGTTMGDYLRCSDLSHLPREACAPYDDGPPPAMRA